MKNYLLFYLLFCMMIQLQAQAPNQNLLLRNSNAPIEFNKVTPPILREAFQITIAASDERIKKLAAVPTGKHTFENTGKVLSDLIYYLNNLGAKTTLIAETYSDDSTREVARNLLEQLTLYQKKLYLRDDIFLALKDYASHLDQAKLSPQQKKFLKDAMLAFKKNGIDLPVNQRQALEAILAKTTAFENQFDKNIAEHQDSAVFTATELKGVDPGAMSSWARGNDRYVIQLNRPNYVAVIENAVSGNTRHEMYLKNNNRGYPKNVSVLDSMLYFRSKFALQLGVKTYAEYVLIDKMAQNPKTVWEFENSLITKLTPMVTKELSELKELKKKTENKDTIFAWDDAYYRKKVLESKYNLNMEEVKEYFEAGNSLKGMFTVFEKLFNIQVKVTTNTPVWNEKVKTYELYNEGKKAGSFYLDLYPRKNKFNHFACFPIQFYSKGGKEEVLPVASLICNFPEGNGKDPVLLTHEQVATLFHEFGHLVHFILTRTDIEAQDPGGMKWDFIEAPSQFLENWCWNYEALSMFARHYKTNEVIPKTLFDKLYKSRASAIANMRQLYLGSIDMTFEDKYDSIKGTDLNLVSKKVYEMNQIPFVNGSHFIYGFGHLNGYAAQYYGYLWSKVFAQDMFSIFTATGVMNPTTGNRYKKEILEKGSSVEEIQMVRNFLKREPNNQAFLKSLEGQ